MPFGSPETRAFSRKTERFVLLLVGAVSLTAFGVLLHSIWVLRP